MVPNYTRFKKLLYRRSQTWANKSETICDTTTSTWGKYSFWHLLEPFNFPTSSAKMSTALLTHFQPPSVSKFHFSQHGNDVRSTAWLEPTVRPTQFNHHVVGRGKREEGNSILTKTPDSRSPDWSVCFTSPGEKFHIGCHVRTSPKLSKSSEKGPNRSRPPIHPSGRGGVMATGSSRGAQLKL